MAIVETSRTDRPLLSIQRNLDEAFQRHATSKIDLSPKLGVRTSDGKAYLLNLEDFDETMMTEEVMSVGRINSWVKGITSWRGRVFTIIDMSVLFDCPQNSENGNNPVFGSILNPTSHEKNWALVWSGGTEGLVDVSKFKKLVRPEDGPVWISGVYEDSHAEKWYALDIESLLTIEKLSKVL